MNYATKAEVVEIANRRRYGISDAKGPEYAAEDYTADTADVLANFKRQGTRWGVDALVAAGVYFGKHIDSIETFIRQYGAATPNDRTVLVERGEGIVSRLDDARNYLDLIECLLVDAGVHPEHKSPFKAGSVIRQIVDASQGSD